MDWQRGGGYLGANSGLAAEVSQIGGEAVAQVNGRGGQAVALKPDALGDARLRVEVRSK
jgi:hypothetical protein